MVWIRFLFNAGLKIGAEAWQKFTVKAARGRKLAPTWPQSNSKLPSPTSWPVCSRAAPGSMRSRSRKRAKLSGRKSRSSSRKWPRNGKRPPPRWPNIVKNMPSRSSRPRPPWITIAMNARFSTLSAACSGFAAKPGNLSNSTRLSLNTSLRSKRFCAKRKNCWLKELAAKKPWPSGFATGAGKRLRR